MDIPQKSYLEKLQALDEQTKKWVLICSTAAIMVVVVYLWLAYVNGLVASANQPDDENQSPVAETSPMTATSPEPGFWSRVGNGAAIVGQTFGGSAQWIGNEFESPKDYEIKPGK